MAIPQALLRELFGGFGRSDEELQRFADEAAQAASQVDERVRERARVLAAGLSSAPSEDARLAVLIEDSNPPERRVAAGASLAGVLRILRSHGITRPVTYLPNVKVVFGEGDIEDVAVILTQEHVVLLPSGRTKEYSTYSAVAVTVDGIYWANEDFTLTEVTLAADQRLRLAFNENEQELVERLISALLAVRLLNEPTLSLARADGARPAPRLIRSPADAEAVAAEWLQYYGFGDVALTGAGADAGMDVTADEAVAQVKMEALPTGRPVIQQIHGCAALEHKTAVVFSLAGYTSEAVSWADRARIPLFQFDFQGEPAPVNAPARTLAARAVHGD